MAGAKTGGNKKTAGLRLWMLNGKKITPVLYNGRACGHGKYFAGEVDGKLVVDDDGKPVPFAQIGELVEQ
jgi:hypothetical protein